MNLTDQEIDLLAGAANSNDFVARANALADVVERIVAAREYAAVWQERAAWVAKVTTLLHVQVEAERVGIVPSWSMVRADLRQLLSADVTEVKP